MSEETKRQSASTPTIVKVRKAVRAAVPVAIIASVVAGVRPGTLCSMGYDAIAYICPLGALESLFGGGAWAPRMLIVLAVVVAITAVVGKAFCSWACPVPPLSDFLSSKKRRQADHVECAEAGKRAGERWKACHGGCASCAACAAPASGEASANAESAESSVAMPRIEKKGRRGIKLDGRHVVLAGALCSSFLCGFPVFCLVCPIGLTFATAIAINRLVGFNEPTIGLLVFPAIIVLELTVLRKWCHRFCPVGALLSLIAGLSKVTQPKVDREKCLRSEGVACHLCAAACPEHLDPCENLGDRPLSECTRCGRCVQACPKGAVSFLAPKRLPKAAKTAHGDAPEERNVR